MYPFVSLETLQVDDVLARRLPRQLAYYHLALPIGVDDEGITVVMAQPENHKAREVIQNALGEKIIPTKGRADQIRSYLDRIWETSFSLSWRDVAVVDEDEVTAYYLRRFQTVYPHQQKGGGENTELDKLMIQRFSATLPVYRESSVLFVERIVNPIQHILQLVRLHMPDLMVMSSILPIAQQDHAQITLLPDSYRVASDFVQLMDTTTPPGQHLEAIREHITQSGVDGKLQLRQGAFVDVLRAELANQPYDMVAVAADAYGEIVEVLIEVIQSYQVPALLILRPRL